jgi:MSHA biogenesis protein MshL
MLVINKNVFFVIIIVLAISACASDKVKPIVNSEVEKLKKEIEEYQQQEKKKRIIEDKIKEIKESNRNKESVKAEAHFDINTDALDAKLFYMNLMSGTEKNIVVHPDVKGEVTLNLSQVTLPEVLNVVREVYGYDY